MSLVAGALLRLLLVASIACAGGCAWWSRTTSEPALVTEGLGDHPAQLDFEGKYAWYEREPAVTSVFLSDIPPEELAGTGEITGQVVHLQIMWLPRPGWTPARRGCTNTVIRLLVFSRGEIGLYGGGGFTWPWDEPGDPRFGMDVLASSLSLLARTEGFVDLLSPAQMTGVADAPMDESGARWIRRVASQRITNALGSPRWAKVWEGLPVDGEDPAAPAAAHSVAQLARLDSAVAIVGETASRSGSSAQ